MEIVEQIKQIVEDLDSKKDLIDKLAKRNTELERLLHKKYIKECGDTLLGEHVVVSHKLLKELLDKVDDAYCNVDSIVDEFNEVESLADEIRDKACYHDGSSIMDELREIKDEIEDILCEEEESKDA